MPHSINLLSLLKTTTEISIEAGKKLHLNSSPLVVNFIGAKDVKLQADRDTEAFIRERLGAATPFPIIGEEEGGDDSLLDANQPYWVIDPLDGTYNYFRDLGVCCVSVGLMCGREPLLGVIYDFNTDQLYSAAVHGETPDQPGTGLLFGGRRMSPAWAEGFEQAVVATGFPAAMDFSSENLTRYLRMIQKYNKVRMIGSAALCMAYVAAGKLDAYIEDRVRLWDIAAGLALAKAAGAALHWECVKGGAEFACNIKVAGKQSLLDGI